MSRLPAALLLVVGALLAPAVPAGAQGAPELEDALDAALLGIQEASRLLLEHDRPGAADALGDALADADDAVAAAGGMEDAKAAKKAASFRKAVEKARDAMADPNVGDLPALKAAAKAAKSGVAALAVLRRLPTTGPSIVEVGAKSAGFHGPGDDVEFRVLPGLDGEGGPCLEEPQVAVIDPYGNGTVVPELTSIETLPGGGLAVSVVMGESGGSARVTVTSCGVTRQWLLFNQGPTGTFAPKPGVDRFDGTYEGSYSGTANVPGVGSVPVSGEVSLTVADGVITVNAPGSGVGNLSAKGAAGFAGAGGTDGASYTFSGKFTATSFGTGPGSASAGGSWTATFDGGTAHGTWSAGR